MLPEKKQSGDERMIKFKGHNLMKQYIKSKPIKWGFKAWLRAGSQSGFVYQFEPYTGKKLKPEVGLGEEVILTLAEQLIGTGCEFYFDNFFTSPKLLSILHANGINATGTCRRDRVGLPQNVRSDKEMKRGDIDSHQSSDQKLNFVKFHDTKPVYLVSNCVSAKVTNTKMRKQKGTAEKVSTQIPEMVTRYNSGMGGVDKSDQMKGTYAFDRRSRTKYYLRVFFDLLDTAMVNGWITHNMVQKAANRRQLDHLEFQQSVVKGLLGSYNTRRNNAPTAPVKRRNVMSVTTARQLSAPQHLPEFNQVRKRCRMCTANGLDHRSQVSCVSCGAYFCLNNLRNCFKDAHNQLV